MSTKIYNGYLYPGGDLIAAIQHLNGLRGQVETAASKVVSQYYARVATRKIDQAHQRGEQMDKSLLGELTMELLERRRLQRADGRRDTEIDTEASAVLLPANGKVLVLVFAERDEIRDIITRDLSPYPYWDNTDRPEGMSEEMWEKRRLDWEAALSADPLRRPSACGPIIEFVQPHDVPNVDLILENLPSRRERARAIVTNIVLSSRLSAMDSPRMSDIMRMAREENWEQAERDLISTIEAGLPEIDRETL